MKKYITILFITSIITVDIYAVSIVDKLFGISAKIRTEKTQLENSVNKKFSDISAELSLVKEIQVDNQLKLSALSNNSLRLQDVESLISSKIVGYDKSVKTEQSAGRDIINDTELIKFIFDKQGILAGLILFTLTSFLGSIITLFKWQGKMYKNIIEGKQEWIENLIKSNDKKDKKLDEWLMSKIDNQLKIKK